MSDLSNKINDDLKAAMKERNQLLVGTLRMLLSAVKNKRIELLGEELSDERIIDVVQTEIKKRKDSIASYLAGNRQDLADQEQKEINILLAYQPEQLGEEAIESKVREVVAGIEGASREKFGQIMGLCMAKLKNQADGNAVKAAVEKILSEKE